MRVDPAEKYCSVQVPDMDDIYEPRGTTQRLDSLIAAGFTDLKYEVTALSFCLQANWRLSPVTPV